MDLRDLEEGDVAIHSSSSNHGFHAVAIRTVVTERAKLIICPVSNVTRSSTASSD
jgi:hypothetical protein